MGETKVTDLFDEMYPPGRYHDKDVIREVLGVLTNAGSTEEEMEAAKMVGETWVSLNRGVLPEAEELFDPPGRPPIIVHTEGGQIRLD